jgi:AraC-like DNA-binding protein
VPSPLAWYREFLPCEALRADVSALFSFGPASGSPPCFDIVQSAPGNVERRHALRELACHGPIVCAPQFADGHVSIMFELGRTLDAEGRWRLDAGAVRGTAIGPMTAVGRTGACELSETVGAYFRPARAAPFVGAAISELTDSAVAVGDLWGSRGGRLPAELRSLSEAARLDRLESFLMTRLRNGRDRSHALDVTGLAAHVLRRQGRIRVDTMACAAGVSRQHLSREFRERIGIGPKLYGRLARFQSVLSYSGARTTIDWAGAAVDMGFADQSHMIAELRRFAGLTPQALADREWFHPFIERVRSTAGMRRVP